MVWTRKLQCKDVQCVQDGVVVGVSVVDLQWRRCDWASRQLTESDSLTVQAEPDI